MNDIIRIWENILNDFKELVGENNCNLIFQEAQVIDIQPKKIVLYMDVLSESLLRANNNNLFNLLEQIAKNKTNPNIKIIIKNNIKKKDNELEEKKIVNNYKHSNLNETLTLKNYFSKEENRNVTTIIQEILNDQKNKTNRFNSLFIYGKSGIGKTHIVNALGNELFNQNHNLKILYKRSGEFINEYTNLFKYNENNKQEEFNNIYYNLDVLILDDIQQLENKESTLNEFFSIYEKMLTEKKLVIITSDINIKKLNFPERLASRILNGLVTQINEPNSDTKIEIFKYHAKTTGIDIEESAIQVFINNSQNVRELIGYISNILIEIISKNIQNKVFTQKDAIDFINKNTINISFSEQDIIDIICDYYDVNKKNIFLKNRKNKENDAKNFIIYFLSKKLDYTQIKLAKMFGYKDHSAINKILKKMEEELETKYMDDYKVITKKLNN